ncbi:MAG: alpha/beta fold hydrolase [Alphaproteobacteria bacterium]|nr:alpha/beta fold hydrolase [Alphaproteobacteria bacterium]
MEHLPAPETSRATESDWSFPVLSPSRKGMICVDDFPRHEIYWEEYGFPDGEPVVFLHGGPGGASEPEVVRFFDPHRYRIILFDQRGCGRSSPLVSQDDPRTALRNNTTSHLIRDIVNIRSALDIKGKMHLFGASWGSALAMAYAVQHSETIQTLILQGVFVDLDSSLKYIYQGNADSYEDNPHKVTAPGAYVFYPSPWRNFVEFIPPNKRHDMLKAYKEIFDMTPTNRSERDFQMEAAATWFRWGCAIGNLVSDPPPEEAMKQPALAVKAFCSAQIETHYFSNNLFMEPSYILNHVPSFSHLPIHIVHGRFDQVCPISQAQAFVNALEKAGTRPASCAITVAGHDLFERGTCLALSSVIKNLPPMNADGPCRQNRSNNHAPSETSPT